MTAKNKRNNTVLFPPVIVIFALLVIGVVLYIFVFSPKLMVANLHSRELASIEEVYDYLDRNYYGRGFDVISSASSVGVIDGCRGNVRNLQTWSVVDEEGVEFLVYEQLIATGSFNKCEATVLSFDDYKSSYCLAKREESQKNGTTESEFGFEVIPERCDY